MNTEIIELYLRSLRPILHIESDTFKRTCFEITECCQDMKHYAYLHGVGVINPKNYSIQENTTLLDFLDTVKDCGYSNPNAIILCNVNEIDLQSSEVISRLSYIAERTLDIEGYHAFIFLVSHQCAFPQELEKLITIIPMEIPSQIEIENYLEKYAKELEFEINESERGALALELKGLSFFQIKRILDTAYVDGGVVTIEDRNLILQEKKQVIKKSGLLEYVPVSKHLSDVGGLEYLKEWLERKKNIIAHLDDALKSGVSTPKGILIVGFPGCGKSLVAKTTAAQFNLPLLRLDIGRILGKYVGESEQKMRSALALAEAVSPCVLWIDEVEKAFGGATNSGHEVTMRLIGHFLTWMQEKESTVFVVATANDLEKLPPEFLRKGRFDEVFSVSLPSPQERYQILKIHLQRRGQYDSAMNLSEVIKKTDNFSGADIEAGVNIAVEKIFLANLDRQANRLKISEQDLLDAMSEITPLSKALKEKFTALKDKLQEYSVKPASS